SELRCGRRRRGRGVAELVDRCDGQRRQDRDAGEEHELRHEGAFRLSPRHRRRPDERRRRRCRAHAAPRNLLDVLLAIGEIGGLVAGLPARRPYGLRPGLLLLPDPFWCERVLRAERRLRRSTHRRTPFTLTFRRLVFGFGHITVAAWGGTYRAHPRGG